MLPYLAADPKTGAAPFQCATCQDPDARQGFMPAEVRRSWHCGWLPREEWTAHALEAAMFDGGYAMDDGACCDVCPGYLATMPQAREASHATWALRKGVLAIYHPEPTALLLEAVRALDQAYSLYEARRNAEAAARANP